MERHAPSMTCFNQLVQFRINWMCDLLHRCLLYFVGFGFGATNPAVTTGTGKTHAVPSHV